MRWPLWLIVAAVLGGGLGFLVRTIGHHAPAAPPIPVAALEVQHLDVPAPDFTLTDQFGRPARLSSLRGHVVVLAFISSRCTNFCVLTSEVLREGKARLGHQANHVRLIAVNANPNYRSVTDVLYWSGLHHMTHEWRFLTGPIASLRTVWRAYDVASKVRPHRQLSHVPAVYVIDARGRERAVFLVGQSRRGIVSEGVTLARLIRPLLPRP